MSVKDVKISISFNFIINNHSRIQELCANLPEGITDDVILNDCPTSSTKERVMAINRLLTSVCHNMLKLITVVYLINDKPNVILGNSIFHTLMNYLTNVNVKFNI